MNICVYGASSAFLEEIYYKKTEELGREIGRREFLHKTALCSNYRNRLKERNNQVCCQQTILILFRKSACSNWLNRSHAF